MREAIAACERISGQASSTGRYSDQARMGDHRWWISRPVARSRRDYPEWELEYDLETTLREIHDFNVERWLS